MKKKNNLYRKIGNKKLALNKQKISELSSGNMGEVKGGGPITWEKACVKASYIDCPPTKPNTNCYCNVSYKWVCFDASIGVCEESIRFCYTR